MQARSGGRHAKSHLDPGSARGRLAPEGGSDPLGVWGYIKALEEIKKQVDTAKIKLDAISVAVGSGGTYAGLYLGSKITGWNINIIGYAVCRDSGHFQRRIFDICLAVEKELGADLKLNPADIEIDDRFIGPGYAKIGPKEANFIKDIARHSGIVLDPAYTGKSLLGLFTAIKEGRFKRGSKVMFIHTGGQWGLVQSAGKIF